MAFLLVTIRPKYRHHSDPAVRAPCLRSPVPPPPPPLPPPPPPPPPPRAPGFGDLLAQPLSPDLDDQPRCLQMCPLQLNFSPGSPHNGRPSKAGSPLPVDIAIMPSEAMQPEQQGPGPMTLAILPAKEGEEEDVDAAAVLAADRQALQMQVVRTGQEAAQVSQWRRPLAVKHLMLIDWICKGWSQSYPGLLSLPPSFWDPPFSARCIV